MTASLHVEGVQDLCFPFAYSNRADIYSLYHIPALM